MSNSSSYVGIGQDQIDVVYIMYSKTVQSSQQSTAKCLQIETVCCSLVKTTSIVPVSFLEGDRTKCECLYFLVVLHVCTSFMFISLISLMHSLKTVGLTQTLCKLNDCYTIVDPPLLLLRYMLSENFAVTCQLPLGSLLCSKHGRMTLNRQ